MSLRLSVLLTLALPFLWVVSRVPTFYAAYTRHLLSVEADNWLRTQCEDPLFVSRMMQHPDVCESVRQSYHQPAFLVALQACIPSEWHPLFMLSRAFVSWEIVVLIGLVLFLAPSLLLPLYRIRKEQLEQARMLEACSPDLPGVWIYPACAGNGRDNNNNTPRGAIGYAHDVNIDSKAVGASRFPSQQLLHRRI